MNPDYSTIAGGADSQKPGGRTRLIAVILATAWPLAAAADEPRSDQADTEREAEEAAIELEEITTTGTATPTAVLDAPSDLDVVSGAEKRRQQGASLGDSLDHLAGVSNIATGSQVGKPVIRGLSGNRIRVLSDGVGVNHQQYGVRHSPNIEPYFADRIEVVRGAASILYGSDAIGGAVNVIPVPVPYARDGAVRFDGRLMTDLRGVNDEQTYALRANAAGESIGLTAGLVYRSAGNITTPDIGTFPETGIPGRPNFSGELDHTDYDQRNAEFAVGYRGDRARVELRYQRWENEHNFLLPPPVNLPDGIGIGQNLENDTLQLSAEWFVSPTWTLEPSLSWVRNLRQSNPGPGGTTRETGSTREFLPEDIVIDLERDSYTARLEARHRELPALGGASGRLGIEYVSEDQESFGPVALAPGGEIENIALFALEEWRRGDWIFNAGVRYDDREQTADPDRTFDTSVIPDDPALLANSYSVFSGSLGATWKFADGWSAVANLGRAYRAPELFELYVNGVHGGVAAQQEGNPNLDEEVAFNTDFGLRFRSRALQLKVTVYRNRIDDYIFLSNTGETNPGGLPIYRTEQDDATLTGGDLTLRWFATDRLDFRLTAETVRGDFDATGEDLPLLPADQATLGVVYRWDQLGEMTDVYLRGDVHHAADKDSAGRREPFSQFDNTPFGTASTEAYTRLDVGAGFEWPVGERSVSVDVGVDNVLDEDYRDFLDTYKGYALSPGRNYWLKLGVPFGR
jgi:iron complex outermembrane receptor protein/hemoglobin/transferrin/lactoferrin receptor protein